MQCFVINVASATDRLAHMAAGFGRLGLSFERIDAVTPHALASHPVMARFAPMRYRPWVEGEFATLLSHYAAWQRIADGDDPFGAVFEDDAHLHPRIVEALRGDFPQTAGIVKLETFVEQPAVISRRRWRAGGLTYARLHSAHYGAAAYILSRWGARQLTRPDIVFDMPVDHVLFDICGPEARRLGAVQVVPGLAVQDHVLAQLAGMAPRLPSLVPGREGREPVATSAPKPPSLAVRLLTAPWRIPVRHLRTLHARLVTETTAIPLAEGLRRP